MKNLLMKWKGEHPDYQTKYSEGALEFINYLEEIQDFPLFNNVIDIVIFFDGDFGYEHCIDLIFANNNYVTFCYAESNGFYIDFDQVEYYGENKDIFINDWEIVKKILLDSNDVNNLQIPYDIVDVYRDNKLGIAIIKKNSKHNF